MQFSNLLGIWGMLMAVSSTPLGEPAEAKPELIVYSCGFSWTMETLREMERSLEHYLKGKGKNFGQ